MNAKLHHFIGVCLTMTMLGGILYSCGHIIANAPPYDPSAPENSLAYVDGCMDFDTFISRSKQARDQVDWSQIDGSAMWPDAKKLAAGSSRILQEMKRINVQACPDMQPIVKAYWRKH